MNSTSLSVRSIAVDFMISLLGSTFEENGTIDEILLVVFTVLLEVAAREVAMQKPRYHSNNTHYGNKKDSYIY
jgi:hypothetical protein